MGTEAPKTDPPAGTGSIKDDAATPQPSIKAMWPVGVLGLGAAAVVAGALWAARTKPKIVMESPMKEVVHLRASGDFDAALECLNGKTLAYMNLPERDEDELREYFLLRARTLHDAQARAGVTRQENYVAIVNDYEAAEKRGAKLDAADTVRLSEAYLGTGHMTSALDRVRTLPPSENERRRKLLKVIVERGIADQGKKGIDASKVLDLLLELAAAPGLSPEDSAWTLAREAELLIGIGMPDDAATRLMREMQRIKNVPRPVMGELFFLLGKAQFQGGEKIEATRQLDRAMELLGPMDPMQAPSRLMTARVLQGAGQVEEARDRYREIIKSFKSTPEYLPALQGLASVTATLGDEDESLATYSELVEALEQRGAAKGEASIDGLKISDVTDGLMARHDEQAASDHTRQALRYAAMAEGLYPPDNVPAPVLLALGSTSRRLAHELMGVDAGSTTQPVLDEASIDRASREEARRLYLASGKYYQRHAREVIVADPAAAARSRWEAADVFDAGGETDAAIREFTYYMQGASDDDPRRPEAKFRLAQSFEATGDLKTAAALFRELLEAKRASAGGSNQNDSVLWGDRSIVPLAHCYAMDADDANDAEAEQLLLDVLSGRDLAPEAPEFRDALIELGAFYYQRERYPDAAMRLAEAEERFPRDRDIITTRYRLADSLRLSADEIDRQLRDAMPSSERQELEKMRRTRRRDAIRLYGTVRASIEAKPEKKRREVERVYLRNSMFYQGDCAYDLGDFDAAITYYDDAKQKYSDEPASLVAMVQIVNAYVQRGEWAKAATANERAVQQLEKFPDSVWTKPGLPMEKKHWTRWLDSRALLDHRQQATAGKE